MRFGSLFRLWRGQDAGTAALTYSTKFGATQNGASEVDAQDCRFRQMLLLIVQRCRHREDLSIRIVMRVLYLSEAVAFGRRHKPITGLVYEMTEFGPAPRRLRSVLGSMLGGAMDFESRATPGGLRRCLVATRAPDLAPFSDEEMAIVEAVSVIVLANLSASGDDWRKQKNGGWRLTDTDDGASIPYDFLTLSLWTGDARDIRLVRGMMPSGWRPPVSPAALAAGRAETPVAPLESPWSSRQRANIPSYRCR